MPAAVMTTTIRTWRMAPADPTLDCGAPRPPDISLRGLCLLHIEFLTRYPASECVVTSDTLSFLDTVLDMFPKTLFHVFCSKLEDPPRPNVIRHGSTFDKGMAGAWRERGGAPFNLIFTGEGMESQMALHVLACPAAALHMITAPPEHYLGGDLIYPPYCPRESCLSAMVPDGDAQRRSSTPRTGTLTRWGTSTRTTGILRSRRGWGTTGGRRTRCCGGTRGPWA